MVIENKVICGDALDMLKKMPDNIADVILTSPPYYGLRDYKVEGQIGLEKNYEQYLDNLTAIFKECQRVLKPTGSIWIVIGDTYSNVDKWTYIKQGQSFDRAQTRDFPSGKYKHFKLPPKCLMLIPQRLMLRLIDTGWIIRNDVVWHKPNRMPSSVNDRLTNAYEHIIFAVKNRRYFFNLYGIQKPYSQATVADKRLIKDDYRRGKTLKDYESHLANNPQKVRHNIFKGLAHLGIGADLSPDQHYQGKFSGFGAESEQYGSPRARSERKQLANTGVNNKEPYQTNNPHSMRLRPESPPQGNKGKHSGKWQLQAIEGRRKQQGIYEYEQYGNDNGRRGRVLAHPNEGVPDNPMGANPGDVFICNTQPQSIAHFATFPLKLVEFVLKAACPKDGIILDPFMGSGTVAVVAKQMGRKYVGIELNSDYVSMAEKRLAEIDAIQLDIDL